MSVTMKILNHLIFKYVFACLLITNPHNVFCSEFAQINCEENQDILQTLDQIVSLKTYFILCSQNDKEFKRGEVVKIFDEFLNFLSQKNAKTKNQDLVRIYENFVFKDPEAYVEYYFKTLEKKDCVSELVSQLFAAFILREKGILCSNCFDFYREFNDWRAKNTQSVDLENLLNLINDPFNVKDNLTIKNKQIDEIYAKTITDKIFKYYSDNQAGDNSLENQDAEEVKWITDNIVDENFILLSNLLEDKDKLTDWILKHKDLHSLYFNRIGLDSYEEYTKMTESFKKHFFTD